LGFQIYSLSDEAAKAFQLSLTVLKERKKKDIITFHSREKLNMQTQNIQAKRYNKNLFFF
jgi:hypothetical protein